MTLGSSQNGRGRPQKGITAGFSLELGHFRLCEGAVTHWEPFKSEYFLIFGDFSGISWVLLTSGSPNLIGQSLLRAGNGLHKLNLLFWNQSEERNLDRENQPHLLYR
jgi:hypothetical protein